jgi:hypothetical protein
MHSAIGDLREVYRFHIDKHHGVRFKDVKKR